MLKRIRISCVGGLIVGLLFLLGSYESCSKGSMLKHASSSNPYMWWEILGIFGFIIGIGMILASIISIMFVQPKEFK